MIARRFAALLLAAACLVGMASASSLGTFEDVPSGALRQQVAACQQQDVTLLSDGSGLDLLDLLTSTVDQIKLSGLTGDCNGMRPVVVVYGDDNLLDGDDTSRVLSRTMLGSLSGTSDAVFGEAGGDPLIDLVGALSTRIDEIRVAYCPVGVTACEP